MKTKNVSIQRAQKLSLRLKKEMDKFHKKYYLGSNGPMTLVLKNHLYIEFSFT